MPSPSDAHHSFPPDQNPYQPAGPQSGQPTSRTGFPNTSAPDGTVTLRLASLWQRFAGFVIDSFIPLLFVIPGMIPILMTVFRLAAMERNGGQPAQLDSTGVAMLCTGVGIMFIGGLLLFVAQIYLLWVRSQTIGKILMKTQIVDFETGKPAEVLATVVLRTIVNGLIANLPCIGVIYGFVDVFFIFRDDRRCLHDLLASTTVVDISDR